MSCTQKEGFYEKEKVYQEAGRNRAADSKLPPYQKVYPADALQADGHQRALPAFGGKWPRQRDGAGAVQDLPGAGDTRK